MVVVSSRAGMTTCAAALNLVTVAYSCCIAKEKFSQLLFSFLIFHDRIAEHYHYFFNFVSSFGVSNTKTALKEDLL